MHVLSSSPNLEVRELEAPRTIDADTESTVQDLWRRALSEGANLVDGRIFSVESVSPAVITGTFVPYRWLVAQLTDPALFAKTRVEPLAVAGRTCTSDGRIVFGCRAAGTMQDPGSWELAPAGGVDPSARSAGGAVDLMIALGNELEEELGVTLADVKSILSLGIVIDPTTHVHDVVFAINLAMSTAEVEERFLSRPHPEYEQIKLVSPGADPASAGVSPLGAVSRVAYLLPSARMGA